MNPDGESHVGPSRHHEVGLFQFNRIIGGENYQRTGQTCVPRALDDGIEIRTELRARDVAVRIDHRTRQPGSTPSGTATSVGLPPSGLAASSIPFDSIPINFAGLRLATTTTMRLTRSAG